MRRIQERKITVSMSTIFPNVAYDYDRDAVLVHIGIITINPYVYKGGSLQLLAFFLKNAKLP